MLGSEEPITEENLVEFHLLYSGPLHSSGNKGQRKEAHAIRKVFHSQLRRLWNTHSSLRKMAQMAAWNMQAGGTILPLSQMSEDDSIRDGLNGLGLMWNRNGFNFLPLVTEKLCLRCSLDILFLRAEERNYILQGGDIDGRLMTLFDSLRITNERDQLPPGATPSDDENPFFCLLQNDDLISEVRVNTDRLLQLPETRELKQSEVFLQITVRLNPTKPTEWDWVF